MYLSSFLRRAVTSCRYVPMMPDMTGCWGPISVSSLSDSPSSSKLASTSAGVSVRGAGCGDTPWMQTWKHCMLFYGCMYVNVYQHTLKCATTCKVKFRRINTKTNSSELQYTNPSALQTIQTQVRYTDLNVHTQVRESMQSPVQYHIQTQVWYNTQAQLWYIYQLKCDIKELQAQVLYNRQTQVS